MNITTLKLSELDAHPQNPRSETLPSDALRASLKKGQTKPIVVRKNGDRWQILCGHRTVATATAMGMTQLEATVVDVNDKQALHLLVSDNTSSVALTSLGKARSIDLLLTSGESKAEVNRVMECSDQQRNRLRRLLTLPIALQEALEASEVTGSNLVTARACMELQRAFADALHTIDGTMLVKAVSGKTAKDAVSEVSALLADEASTNAEAANDGATNAEAAEAAKRKIGTAIGADPAHVETAELLEGARFAVESDVILRRMLLGDDQTAARKAYEVITYLEAVGCLVLERD